MHFCFQHFGNLASQPWLFPINQTIGGWRRSWEEGEDGEGEEDGGCCSNEDQSVHFCCPSKPSTPSFILTYSTLLSAFHCSVQFWSQGCLPWPVDISCWRLLQVPSWETVLGGCKGGLLQLLEGWLADRDWFRRAKLGNSRGSFESRLSNCVDRTRWESYGRGICLGLRRNSQLHQLGTRPAQKPQKQSLTRRGRLCSHEHKGWNRISQRQAMVNSQEMEWCLLRS